VSEFVIAVLVCTAVVYGTSATAKLSSRAAYLAYQSGLGDTSLVSSRRLPALAAALAFGEAVVAAALVAAVIATTTPVGQLMSLTSLAAAAVLTGILTVGVAITIRGGTGARCACFGASSVRPLSAAHVCRDASLLLLVTVGLIAAASQHDRPTLAGLAVAGPAAVVAGLLLIRLDDLIDLFAPMPAAGLRADVTAAGPSAAVSPPPRLRLDRSGR
jgi:hypothetical protein